MNARRPAITKAPFSNAVTLRIEHMGNGGDGVGTLPDGALIYVAATVPGDLVHVRPQSRRGDGWAGEIDSILEQSPARRSPVCAHFGACGGCTSQHWNEADYLAWKTNRLEAALHRAGFENPAIAPIVRGAPATRRRMDLAVRRTPEGVAVGLHRARGGEIIDLTECAVLHPALFDLIAPSRALLSGLAAIRREASMVVNLLDSGPDVLLRTDADLTVQDRTKLTRFAQSLDLPRVSWARGAGIAEPVCLLRPPITLLSGIEIAPPAGAFLQPTRDGEAAIIGAVLDGLPAKRPARAHAVELYAGCGTISFALARRIRVLAMEGDEALVSACRDAVNKAELMGKLEPRCRDLARQPLQARELAACAAVILDPPHAGAAAQMPFMAQAKVPTVIYVSCDPVSLGRDAAILRTAGYRLEKATPIDQFLWSAGLESVSVFRAGR